MSKNGSGVKIAASILAADFRCLQEEIAAVEQAGADILHLDVMDGSFVPNISFGPMVVEAIDRLTALPLHAHLMIQRPDLYAEEFARCGADTIIIHCEAQAPVERTLQQIRKLGCQAGLSANPTTPLEVLEPFLGYLEEILLMSVHPGFGGQQFISSVAGKVKTLRATLDSHQRSGMLIAVDGGINAATAPEVIANGANILVAGSAIFGQEDYQQAIRVLRGEGEGGANAVFEELTKRLNEALRQLRNRGKLSEAVVDEALREIRRALLEADVNLQVAKDFIGRVREKAIGQKVLASVRPGQLVVKIVQDELVSLLGGEAAGLNLSGSGPTAIMLVGLQGSGKTTVAGKLALHLRSKDNKVLLVAADVYRPAAVDQLRQLGGRIDVPVYASEGHDPPEICAAAQKQARQQGMGAVIFDTAGRWHVDDEMMQELVDIRQLVSPQEILLVADAMTGQEAVNLAQEFDNRLGLDGVVLTKLDGDARGGAALSVRAVTGKPIKYVGVGEKLDALEPFYPERMASRILGMGDVVTLVEKAQAAVDLEQQRKLEEKIRKKAFTFDDFLSQLHQLKKMGPLDGLLDLLPGFDASGLQVDEGALVRVEAMINSMTPGERNDPRLIDGSRRRRIARGSGRTVQEVNGLLKQFQAIQKMIDSMDRDGWQKRLFSMRPKKRKSRFYR